MAEWPSSLPNFLEEGYGLAPQPGGVRFQPERGPAKQRLTTRAAPWDMTLTLKLTKAQRDDFWDFWQEDCRRGALSFAMDDPIDGAPSTFRFIIGQEPRESRRKPYFIIAFPLERLV